MNATRLTIALLLLAVSFAAFADDPNVHEIPGAGITLTKPARWTYTTRTDKLVVVQNKGGDGSVFMLALQAMETPPPNAAPELLAYTLTGVRAKYADYKLVEPIKATTVSGLHAAEATATFTASNGRISLLVRSRTILIPREGGLIVISMTLPPESDETASKEVAGMLDSLKITAP